MAESPYVFENSISNLSFLWNHYFLIVTNEYTKHTCSNVLKSTLKEDVALLLCYLKSRTGLQINLSVQFTFQTLNFEDI